MSNIKISQMPLTTGATGPNAFVPVIVDGVNYKIAASDLISQGATGSTGPRGATGATGLKGSTGPVGGTGATGATGLKGATGFTGSTGLTGSTGSLPIPTISSAPSGALVRYDAGTNEYSVSGNLYWNGTDFGVASVPSGGSLSVDPSGVTLTGTFTAPLAAGHVWVGSTGGVNVAQSLTSVRGATGATGLKGSTGFTGSTGSQGPTGNVGATGLKGSTGFTGASGATGPVGNPGATGAQGGVGATGTGATGATGFTGSTGATGPQGSLGSTGATGAGLTGGTGATGPQGLTGATGPAPTQFTVNTVAQAATVTFDLATATGQWHTLNLSSATNLVLATSNRAAGRYLLLEVTNTSGTTRTISYGISPVGTPVPPSSLSTGETAILRLECWGTATADVYWIGYKVA